MAAGGVALVGGGLAGGQIFTDLDFLQFSSPAAAFKFSPSLNGESSGLSRGEKERRLEELKKVR